MTFHYPILELPDELSPRQRLEETMGTKVKFRLRNPRSGQEVMVKYARDNTGEDWSEKLAYELARRISVPCPRVDLFEASDGRGVLCWSFLRGPSRPDEPSLLHGNELLFQRDPDYPKETRYGVARHTLTAVEGVLRTCLPLPYDSLGEANFRDGFDTFVGYLMLDALIGNTDRHHENWGVMSLRRGSAHVMQIAPSYDHASCLGRELTDAKREGRMGPSGRGTVADYAQRAQSAFWRDDGRKLSTMQVLEEAAARRPESFRIWQEQLHGAKVDELLALVQRIPPSRLSTIGKRFVELVLRHNTQRILSI